LPEIANTVDAGAADAPAGSASAAMARKRVTEERTRGFMGRLLSIARLRAPYSFGLVRGQTPDVA
jgi:hypothetical protein